MIFRINNPKADTVWFKNRIIVLVGNYIRIRPIKPNEKKLNDWLLENYHRNLTDTALILLNYMKGSYDGAGNLVFTFNRPKLNRISDLITYGTSSFGGSTILQDAFKKAERDS